MSVSEQIQRTFWDTPPVTRTLVTATVALGVSVHLLRIVPYYYVIYLNPLVFTYSQIPQLWRFVTSFVLPGGKLGLVMDPYFLYTYSKRLEVSARFSMPGEFVTFLLFVSVVIVLLAGYLLEALTFMSPLIMSFAYMYSVDAPDATVGLIIFRIKARYLPWAMLGMSFLLNGPIAVMYEATGLVGGHLYHFLTYIWPTHGGGTNYITVPPLIRRWFPQPRGTTRAYGTAFQRQDPPAGSSTTIRPNAAAGSGSSWASGFTSGSWGSRGPGRRLGGD